MLLEIDVRLLGLSHFHACRDEVHPLQLEVDELGLSLGELLLEIAYLLLEVADGSGAAVDRVSDPRVGLVHHAAHCIRSLRFWKFLQELDDVASSEHSMRNGELVRLGGREVRGQDTLVHAPPAQDLAGGTRAEDCWRRRRRQWGNGKGRRRRGRMRRRSGWR